MKDSNTTYFYKIGWIAAVVSLALGVLEIALTALPSGTSQETETVVEWFQLLQDNWFMGLRNLGLVNIGLVIAGVVLYVALYNVLYKVNPAYVTLAAVTYLIGAAVFFATNRAFPMLALSNQYAVASTDAQRITLEAAGQAMLSVGQSHTPGTFLAFLFTGGAGIIISGVMLYSEQFSRTTAILGIVGALCLTLFEIMTDFWFGLSNFAIAIALVGGILTMIWEGMVAYKLFRMSNERRKTMS